MAKKIVIVVLLIVIAAFAARALIYPAAMQNTSVSPTVNQGETMLISRIERFTNQPFQRFEVVAIVPPFLKGRAYNPVETPLGVFADLTGIPIAPLPSIELQRVIALPGETVVIRKGLGVFIDGKLLDESSYTKDMPHSDLFVLADIVRESLEEGGLLQSYENSEAPIVVPPEMVFVLPDDRKNFSGSNEWGFLPQTRVVGKVGFKIAKNGIEVIKTPPEKFATEKIAINDDGVRALEKGEYTKAIHLFKSSLAIDNNFELARDNLSIAYNNFAIQSAAKPEVALDSLHKALFLDPDNELTKKNLAGILKRMGKDASKYEDRIALAQEALKHHKTISALVEYRAAVKLHPSPTALAKVSSLEAQCNFPPHAIPEDLVTTTLDNTAAIDKPEPRDNAIATGTSTETDDASTTTSSESRLEFGHNTEGISATKVDLRKPAAAKQPVVAKVLDKATTKTFSKKQKKETTTDTNTEDQTKALLSSKKKASKDESIVEDKPVSQEVSTLKKMLLKKEKTVVKNTAIDKSDSGTTEKLSKAEPASEAKPEQNSKDVVKKAVDEEKISKEKKTKEKLSSNSSNEKKSKKELSEEKKLSSESKEPPVSQETVTEQRSASKNKVAAKDKTALTKDKVASKDKTAAQGKSATNDTESKKLASKDVDSAPDDLIPIQGQTPIQRQTLKPNTNSGFDLGSFMKNLVSSFSAKNDPSEGEAAPEGYRGPPRIKKSTP